VKNNKTTTAKLFDFITAINLLQTSSNMQIVEK